ncbi:MULTISPECIES: hypothetical protein [unclassified Chryseobacterium]|uniref:hypothetical protein n=1 Tax=unclassified Chryseobacterium TaxID=2593645 RepID=UPI0030169E7A
MEKKIRVLKVLETIHMAKSKIEYKRLDILINSNLFNTENNAPLWGYELLNLLKEMKEQQLIISDESNWFYSITPQGLNYLKKYTLE